MRSTIVLAWTAGLALASATATAQPTFTLIEPDGDFDYSVIQDVAKDSPLVLVSLQNSTQRPFPLRGYILNVRTGERVELIDPNGSDLNPIAISANGETVAGSLGGGPLLDQHAFVWSEATGVEDIVGLPAGNVSYATGVSGDGTIVVGTTGATFGDPYQQAWRWTRNGGLGPLDDIGEDILIFGSAEDISGDGSTVVGTGSIGDFDPDTDDLMSGVIWAGGGTTPTDLGNLPSPISTGGLLPTAASFDGSVVVGFGPGFSQSGGFANRSFRWTAADGLVDVGSVPGRPEGSVHVTDCSSDGNTLVGYSITGGVDTWEAVVWTQDTGFRTLRSILAAEGVTIPATISLRETYCNGDGSIIAGWAYDRTNNKYRGYIVTLGGEVCGADHNGDGFVDFFDYLSFVSCFEGECAAGTTADFNNDDFVDFFDYLEFVAAFEAGC
jgi:hypothetical protein